MHPTLYIFNSSTFHVPYAPWCWYIYLHNWVIFRANDGKYSSTMEHMGVGKHGFFHQPTQPRGPAASPQAAKQL